MNKINIRGITFENITSILILLMALVSAILQMFGINPLPIKNEEISELVSAVVLIASALWNTWKNRNLTVFSQKAQQIADALRKDEITESDLEEILTKIIN